MAELNQEDAEFVKNYQLTAEDDAAIQKNKEVIKQTLEKQRKRYVKKFYEFIDSDQIKDKKHPLRNKKDRPQDFESVEKLYNDLGGADQLLAGTFKQQAASNLLALEKHGEHTEGGFFFGLGKTTTKYHPDVIRERALIALIKNKYKNGGAIAKDPKGAQAARQELQKASNRVGAVSQRQIDTGFVSNPNTETAEGEQVGAEAEARANLIVNAFVPQTAEFAFDKIQDKYLSLRKGHKDQHLLSMYADDILASAPHSKGRVGSKKRIFSLSKTIDTNRITNVFNFKLEYMDRKGNKDYEGFILNPMVTLNNAQLSALTAKVEFYIRSRDKATLTPIPIQNRGLSTGGKHGVAAINNFQSVLGLQDLTVRLAGDTPETAKRDIDSTVTFYGSNLSIFSTKRGRNLYVPLIQPEGLSFEDTVFGSKDLLMRIGWSLPSAETQKALGYTREQLKALGRQTKTFVMSYYKHSFSFNEDGSFILQADYVSRVSETLQDADVMSETDEHVANFYKSLVSKLSSENYSSTLPQQIQKMVSEYINRVHPTTRTSTKQSIVKFFRLIKDKSQAPLFIRRHTQYFQDKKSAKIKQCLNLLVERSQMYRFSIMGSTFQERLFNESFNRVVAPHYPTFAKKNIPDSFNMPESIMGATKTTVKAFKQKCRYRLLITNAAPGTPEAEVPAPSPPTIQRLLVTKDSEGNALPGLGLVQGFQNEEGELEGAIDITGDVEQVRENSKRDPNNPNAKPPPAVASAISSGDPATSSGRKGAEEEIQKKKEQRQAANAAKSASGDPQDQSEANKEQQQEDAAAEVEAANELAEIDSEYAVYYFRLGDIISAFIDSSETDKFFDREKVSIMLGNIKIKDKIQTLYSIPIALEIYQKVMGEFEKSTSRRFTLQRLITSFLKEVQRYYALGDYVLDSGRNNSAYSMKVGQIRTTKSKLAKLRSAQSLSKLYAEGYGAEPPASDSESIFYYTLSQASTKLSFLDASKLSKWEVGKDRSIIKKISFKQVENQSMKAKQDDNIVKTFNSENGLVMIPQLYNVDVTSFGLVDFYPGMSFFIKPTLIGVSDVSDSPIFKEVGITGLYNVINVEHKISSAGFDTTFKCYNEAVIDWSDAIKRLKPGSERKHKKVTNSNKSSKKQRSAGG